jgi:hypothetical protein
MIIMFPGFAASLSPTSDVQTGCCCCMIARMNAPSSASESGWRLLRLFFFKFISSSSSSCLGLTRKNDTDDSGSYWGYAFVLVAYVQIVFAAGHLHRLNKK